MAAGEPAKMTSLPIFPLWSSWTAKYTKCLFKCIYWVHSHKRRNPSMNLCGAVDCVCTGTHRLDHGSTVQSLHYQVPNKVADEHTHTRIYICPRLQGWQCCLFWDAILPVLCRNQWLLELLLPFWPLTPNVSKAFSFTKPPLTGYFSVVQTIFCQQLMTNKD